MTKKANGYSGHLPWQQLRAEAMKLARKVEHFGRKALTYLRIDENRGVVRYFVWAYNGGHVRIWVNFIKVRCNVIKSIDFLLVKLCWVVIPELCSWIEHQLYWKKYIYIYNGMIVPSISSKKISKPGPTQHYSLFGGCLEWGFPKSCICSWVFPW